MDKAVRIFSQFGVIPEPSFARVRLTIRLAVYFSVWVLVAVAFQVFLQPEGPTESSFSPLQQRLIWPLYTPLMAVIGLAQAATWPKHWPDWAPWVVVIGLAIHGVVTLTRSRRSTFLIFTGVQVLVLTVAVVYFVRQSYLPTGG